MSATIVKQVYDRIVGENSKDITDLMEGAELTHEQNKAIKTYAKQLEPFADYVEKGALEDAQFDGSRFERLNFTSDEGIAMAIGALVGAAVGGLAYKLGSNVSSLVPPLFAFAGTFFGDLIEISKHPVAQYRGSEIPKEPILTPLEYLSKANQEVYQAFE